MSEKSPFHYDGPTSWCPGCGDFQIVQSVEKAMALLGKKPCDVLLVSGIGQAAKLPHYFKSNGFNGLHGRALPAAFGAKAMLPGLTVIVTSGDGDLYGEGGNHLIHAIRRNADLTVVAHDNQIYGLTKGQASPTTDRGQVTPTQPHGVISEPFHPLAFALALGAPFVARSFSKDIELTAALIAEAVQTPGFALIDTLQPCVSFNKVNTYEWYGDRVYRLDGEGHDPSDWTAAMKKATEWGDRIPVGVLYKGAKPGWLENVGVTGDKPTFLAPPDPEAIARLAAAFS
ncbi:MAG: 2-oxoacid ferredoxin oxidoreductase [Nitrospinae bacterium]|nr:2-oxoacid ferredoxin oxidoreductase [Nitrospinota bacterium]